MIEEPKPAELSDAARLKQWWARFLALPSRAQNLIIAGVAAALLLGLGGWWFTGPFSDPSVTARYSENLTRRVGSVDRAAGVRFCIEYRIRFGRSLSCRDDARAGFDRSMSEMLASWQACWAVSRIGERLPDCWR